MRKQILLSAGSAPLSPSRLGLSPGFSLFRPFGLRGLFAPVFGFVGPSSGFLGPPRSPSPVGGLVGCPRSSQ